MRRGGQRSSYLTLRQRVTAAAGLHDWMSPEADATGGGGGGKRTQRE